MSSWQGLRRDTACSEIRASALEGNGSEPATQPEGIEK
jgi:hypothetical protein